MTLVVCVAIGIFGGGLFGRGGGGGSKNSKGK